MTAATTRAMPGSVTLELSKGSKMFGGVRLVPIKVTVQGDYILSGDLVMPMKTGRYQIRAAAIDADIVGSSPNDAGEITSVVTRSDPIDVEVKP